jgi:uncharacterized protein (TIGR00297 family)
MSEEMQGVEGDTGWRKAIPEGRDRLQSRVLAGVVGALLVWLSVDVLHAARTFGIRFPVFVLKVFLLSAAFAFIARRLRAATVGGAAFGGMICLVMTFWTGMWTISVVRSGLTPLVSLFLVTFLATRAGRQQKIKIGLAEARQGRSAAQVIANLSVAAICVSFRAIWIVAWETLLIHKVILMMETAFVAALVEATADTVSSEIGQAFGGDPVLITGLRRVVPGTDGAVTLLGSCAGIAAGALIAISGGWAMHLSVKATLTALVAGICGLFFDSLLGATVERRGWLGNDLVNFASTAFAAALSAVIYRTFLYR